MTELLKIAADTVARTTAPGTSAEVIAANINAVHRGLQNAANLPVAEPQKAPAISVKKSITPDAIICLECGKSGKTLKRHLMSTHGMTPAQYRSKWNLPNDYPMTAPTYAATRSALAKKTGLGAKRG